MDKFTLQAIYDWYFSPGEVLRSIGFYINPYKQWTDAKYRHIFAFDGEYNLYVGQYSVYAHHIDKIFDLEDKREHGLLYLQPPIKPLYSTEECLEYGITNPRVEHNVPVVKFNFLETKNITYLNRRLRPIAQRLYDYGMPAESVFVSKQVDLWNPSIRDICKGKLLKRPDKEWLKNQIPLA